MTNRILQLFLASSLAYSSSALSLDMKDIFHSYSTGSAGVYDTSQGRYWYGGSFTARANLVNTDFARFSPPSIKAGCSGIDIFAGSFGLVSGDELVQMARGIAQGAAGYFFNLAVSSMCSSCAQTMQTMSKKLEEFNRWGRNSCENTMNLMNSEFGLNEKVRGGTEGVATLMDSTAGTITSWIDNIPSPPAPNTCAGGVSCVNAKKVIDGNIIYHNVKKTYSSLTMPGLGLNDLETHELIMSLFGTIITQTDMATCEAKRAAGEECVDILIKGPTLSVKDLLFGSSDGTGVSFVKCVDSTECLDLQGSTETSFKGLYQHYQELLNGSSAEPGIFEHINSKSLVSSEQERLIGSYDFPYVKVATNFKGKSSEQLGEYYALAIAGGQVKNLMDEFLKMVSLSRWAGGDGIKPNTSQELDMLIADARQSLDAAFVEIEQRKATIYQSLTIIAATKNLNSTGIDKG